MKLLVGIPLLFSVVSFVLTMLALFAGHQKGFMEDYHVIMFNTSTLGQNWLENVASGSSSSSSSPTTTAASATTTSTDTGIFGIGGGHKPRGLLSSIEASATALVGSLESQAASILNDVGNDIGDKLANELGIEQFYSIHVMDLCQGDFAPNATDPHGTWLNISSCTQSMDFSAMDISTLLNKQLSVGPFNISLSDLGFTSKLESKLKDLPTIFEALAAMYIVSAVFTGLAVLGAAVSLFLLPGKTRRISLANLALALPGALFLFIGSLLYTVGAAKVVDKIKSMGADDIGLHVTVGTKFEALTWAAFALMVLATCYWVFEFATEFRARKRAGRTRGKGEKHSMDSYRSGNGRTARL